MIRIYKSRTDIHPSLYVTREEIRPPHFSVRTLFLDNVSEKSENIVSSISLSRYVRGGQMSVRPSVSALDGLR